MSRIKIIKALDGLLGRVAVKFILPPAHHAVPQFYKSILLIRPGGIGDAVHLAPAIEILRKYLPGVSIDILAEKRNCEVFGLCGGVRGIYSYDKPWDLFQLLGKRYDAVIDTEQWHRLSAVLARTTRSLIKVGFASNERGKLFTHAVSYSHDDFEADSFLKLVRVLGLPRETPLRWGLAVPTEAADKARALLAGCDDFVVIFTGASIVERQWGGGQYRKLAQVCSFHGRRVVVVGGKDDALVGAEVMRGIDGISFAGQTSLVETAAVIARAVVVVSGDSGILHLAAGLGVSTVSLFGPGIQDKWGPRGDNHIVINKNLPCSPCTKFGYTPKCPYNARCMKEITVEEVEAAVVTLLERTKGGVV